MKLEISKRYEEKKVFDGFSLEIADGEILCVLGASGVGKTTLLHILAGLTSYEGELLGVPQNVGYVFQQPRLLPHLTVEQNLCYAGGKAEEIDEILQKIGLLEMKNKRAGLLSGGEQQRVSLARAFLCGAPLLLMDEPFSALDTRLKLRLMDLFARLWETYKPTVVLVTHDLEEAWALGHRVVLLEEGRVALDVRPPRTKLPSDYGETCEGKKMLLQTILH